MPTLPTTQELEDRIAALEALNQTLVRQIAEGNQARQALQESEERFRAIFEGQQTAILIVDAQTHAIADANTAACALIGIGRDNIIGRNCHTWICPAEQGQCPVTDLEQAIDHSERILLTADGRQVPILKSVNRVMLGGHEHLIESFFDLTDRKHTEEILRHSEAKFAHAFNCNAAVLSISTLKEGRYVEVNDTFCQTFGCTRADVIGKTSAELNLWVDPHQRDLIVAALQRDGKVRNWDIQVLDQHGRRHDGIFSADLITIHDEPHLLVAVNDITERKRAERLLRIQRDLAVALNATSHLEAGLRVCLNAALDASGLDSGGVYLLDERSSTFDLIIHTGFLTQAFIELASHAGVGTSNYDLVMADKPIYSQYLLEARPINPVRQTEGLQAFALIPLQHDGRVIGCLNLASHSVPEVPLYAREALESIAAQIGNAVVRLKAEHEIRRFNAELENRVEQRTAELETANRELKDFASIVSHDLKAPLRAISRLGQWLVDDYAATFDDQGKEMVAMLIQRVKRMDSLIDGILEYSRVGRIAEDALPVDLNRLIQEVIENLAPPAHIHILPETPLPTVTGDKIRLFQVFQNLFSNAVRFLDKPDGQIMVGCEDAGAHWRLRVADNGPGIDPRDHERIFQIFQTLRPRDEMESTGIGLAIVKKIVEFYGGEVGVESTPGAGSVFWFTWPKHAAT